MYLKILYILLLLGSFIRAQECSYSTLPSDDYQNSLYRVTLNSGEQRVYCSLYFLQKDWQNIEQNITAIKGLAYETKRYVDVARGFFVVNSKKNIGFEKYSKIFFEKNGAAIAFQKRYGGDVRSFSFVLYLQERDSDAFDDERYRFFLENEVYAKADYILANYCDIKSVDEIDSRCKSLDKKGRSYLRIALKNRDSLAHTHTSRGATIEVSKSDRCPVCGMFVYKYPKWAAVIRSSSKEQWFFDGVKDMLKFYFEPKRYGADVDVLHAEIFVTDYYKQEKIAAKEAFYVINSDLYGPMGHELIPFRAREDAEKFKVDHGGRVTTFEELDLKSVWDLDL